MYVYTTRVIFLLSLRGCRCRGTCVFAVVAGERIFVFAVVAVGPFFCAGGGGGLFAFVAGLGFLLQCIWVYCTAAIQMPRYSRHVLHLCQNTYKKAKIPTTATKANLLPRSGRMFFVCCCCGGDFCFAVVPGAGVPCKKEVT